MRISIVMAETVLAASLLVLAYPSMKASAQHKGTVKKVVQTQKGQAVASVGQIMRAMTGPTSDILFQASNNTPSAEKDWISLENNALLLAESGNLLMMSGRSQEGTWTKHANDLVENAKAAYLAAHQRDLNSLTEISDMKIYPVCEGCHEKYLKK